MQAKQSSPDFAGTRGWRALEETRADLGAWSVTVLAVLLADLLDADRGDRLKLHFGHQLLERDDAHVREIQRHDQAHEAADVSDERDRGQQPRLFG